MSVDNNNVEWLKMQFIQIRKTDPKKLYFKYTVDEGLADFITVDLTKLRRGRRTSAFKLDFTPLYPKGRKITKEKKSDLMDLINYIPPVFHDFYINLATADDADSSS
jgi:hypothetical protein